MFQISFVPLNIFIVKAKRKNPKKRWKEDQNINNVLVFFPYKTGPSSEGC